MSIENFIADRKQRDASRFQREKKIDERAESHRRGGIPSQRVRHEGRIVHGDDYSYETDNPAHKEYWNTRDSFLRSHDVIRAENRRDDLVERYYEAQIRLLELDEELKGVKDKKHSGDSAMELESKGFKSWNELLDKIDEIARRIRTVKAERGVFEKMKISFGLQRDPVEALRKELLKLHDFDKKVSDIRAWERVVENRNRAKAEAKELYDSIRRIERDHNFMAADLEIVKR